MHAAVFKFQSEVERKTVLARVFMPGVQATVTESERNEIPVYHGYLPTTVLGHFWREGGPLRVEHKTICAS